MINLLETPIPAPTLEWMLLAPLFVLLGVGALGILLEGFLPRGTRHVVQASLAALGILVALGLTILNWIQDNLAADAGLEITVVEFTDYPFGNLALSDGEFEANYFQHVPYFETQVEENGYEIEHSVGIHIEPYGVYSETLTDIADLPEGGKISVPNDPSNQARALWLLEDAGVFTLDPSVADPTIYDLGDNPKNIELVELDAAQLATTLADVDASVINGNYALDAGLIPTQDAIVLESGEDNPYANIVAWRAGEGSEPAVEKLVELLTSEEVRAYIEETWPNGEVIPAF